MSTVPKHHHRVPAPADTDPERPLPHSEEAERAILGAAVQRPEGVCPLLEAVSPEAWYAPAHRTIADGLCRLWAAGVPVDVVSLTQALRDAGTLDGVGGAPYVAGLLHEVASAAAAEHFLTILREKHALRVALAATSACAEDADSHNAEPLAIADQLETAAQSVRDAVTDPTQGHRWQIKDITMTVVEGIERAYEHCGQPMGLATGFKGLDDLTSGLQNSEMIVFAARPSMGKTAFAMNIAEHVALVLKKPVGIFSLEMSKEQLVQRMMCSRARVNVSHVRDGYLTERDFPNLTAAAGKISVAPLLIDDTASLAITDLKARARQMHKASGGLALVVIDYLQLARSTGKKAQESRQVEVSEISAGCKALAKELKIPVIVLAQLNRNVEARAGGGGRPRMSDLRESGAIEQDADVIGFLHRAEYYADDAKAKEELRGQAELIVAKNRNGPVGEVELTFLKEITRFESRA